jgi:GNAT superfamily N-acetyltransferase
VNANYRPPETLAEHHELSHFRCASAEQTEWLRRYARQSSRMGTTRAFVVTERGADRVVAYYAWCMAQVLPAAAPERLRKGAGRYPHPVALLARLGVDAAHEGNGLGAGLLQDALARLVALSPDIGCRGLLVHAESAQARDFYCHLVPEFEPSPTDELHLVLLMKDIRRTLRQQG